MPVEDKNVSDTVSPVPGICGHHTIFGRIVHFHVLRDCKGLYLIDAGFIGAIAALENYLAKIDRSLADLRAILLTHGHLDHTLNVGELQARSGCKVYAPAADRDHVAGTHRYRGVNRICGMAESLGRCLLRYQAPHVDHWFHPGEIFDDLWGGLEVIHLPGHTAGHSGFVSHRHLTLFAGDLFSSFGNSFASDGGHPKPPPSILNANCRQARASILEAARIARQQQLSKVVLNHSRVTTPELLLLDLEKLATSLQR